MHEQFGRYILLERIAIGGMAEIFQAKAPGLGGFEKVLAIKRLHPRYSQDADFIEMLIDEARITVELAHSNIGQIFDLGKVEDHYFIAMEFIDGRDLYRVMKRLRDRQIKFPVDGAAFVAMEACAGLDYAHRKKDSRGRPLNIVHRDVSPQNVLVSFEGDCKLVDFGIAKAALRAYETESGIIKGKFYYMSPEQARGEPLDHRTDVFSLGIVLYEMLTGDLLYKDDDEVTLLSRVRRAEIEPPSRLRPEVPRDLERIVMKALARDRADRYPSAQHMQRDLARFLRDSGAVFNKARLGQLMREIFLNEQPPETMEEQSAVMRDREDPDKMRDRSDFGVDQQSVISFAHFDDGSDSTEVEPSLAPTREGLSLAMEEDPEFMPSELIELDPDDIELLSDPEGGTLEPAFETYDSIESIGTFDEPFEEEETRAFDRAPAPAPALAPVPVATPEPVRVVRAPDPVEFSRRRTPIPSAAPARRAQPRQAQPVRNAVSPRIAAKKPGGGDGFNRQKTVIVPLDQKSGGNPAPARPGRRGDARARTPVGATDRASFITRERVVMGAILLAVIVVTGVLTSLLIEDDPPKKPTPPTVVTTIGGPPPATVGSSNPSSVQVGMPAVGQPVVVGQPVPVAKRMAKLNITSKPAAAQVTINGTTVYQRTPSQNEVPAGVPVDIEVGLVDYEPYRARLTLDPGEQRTVHAVLVEKTATLTVETKPAGAVVYVNGRDRGVSPLTIPGIKTDSSARLRLKLDGYQPVESTIDWTGTRERTVRIDLQPEPLPEVAKVRREAPRARKKTRKRSRPPARRRAPPPARERESSGVGYLSVSSRQWGTVYLDGQKIAAETPLYKYRVSAGRHRVYVNFQGRPSDRSSVRTVTVRPDEVTKVRF